MRPPWTVLAALAVAASCASGAAFAAVDANTASVDALRTVRGVGPRIAQRIVDERRRGPYASLDDLQARVRGVGPPLRPSHRAPRAYPAEVNCVV